MYGTPKIKMGFDLILAEQHNLLGCMQGKITRGRSLRLIAQTGSRIISDQILITNQSTKMYVT